MRAPEFWDATDPWSRLAVAALAPAGWIYGASVAWKARTATPYRPDAAVVCVGNLTVGGTGKTPVAIVIAQALIARGRRPFFLSRGYGGMARGPMLVAPGHVATDVGDEPLLLAAVAPTVVARDRGQGARLAVEGGADVIVMDDGHQNFSLAKDLSFVVVDAERPFGNGRILPAGPLRESVKQGLARADAVIAVGDAPLQVDYAGPILRAHLTHSEPSPFEGLRVLAFAGIGRPEKFFRSLKACGAEITGREAFPDHHSFTLQEIEALKGKARSTNATLVTTEKDFVRLTAAQREGIAVLPVRASFDDGAWLGRLLDSLPGPR